MLRHPPEILITTPESLNLLLSSHSGRAVLTSLSTVILDEIHTVVDNKRGVHLITAVDRLVPLSGEFQRLAVSATARPLEVLAEFIGGLKLEGSPAHPRFVPRPVSIVKAGEAKVYDLKIHFPEDGSAASEGPFTWAPYIREFRELIRRNRSSLFFTRSRRLCESITLQINQEEERPIAYSHHGSLAKELRLEVENRLKAGDLKAIVATNSLELGIDIGALDEVMLVQSPPSISSAVQRVGRAGHRVGETSRGTFFPTHDLDLVASAVIARAVAEGDIERLRPVENALDVLAQILVSMTGTEVWPTAELYNRIRTSWPYRRLSRGQFDLVLDMLSGRYERTRIRELKPRVSVDRLENTAAARKGALLDLFLSGGTIPDRGYFHLRHEERGALIGELDEEFVWEASPGQGFTFGTQHWTIRRITHNEVFVLPARPGANEPPFWKGEVFNRNAHLSGKIAAFLEEAQEGVNDPSWRARLQDEYFMDPPAARRIVSFLQTQKKETGSALPHRCHVLVEHVQTGPGGAPGNQTVLHTFWGGRVNRPFALALDAAWNARFGHHLEIFAHDDCLVLQLPLPISGPELLDLVSERNLESLLRKTLESSGFFGARFRECAGRALLLTRRRLGERIPLWMNRLRSQRLLQAVLRLPDFPILLETWRTCLRDEFDLEALKDSLVKIASGEIQVSECVTSRPSPFARSVTWGQLNQYMYAGDDLRGDRTSGLRKDLLRELVFAPELRPAISRAVIRRFEEKRRRLSPGYAPTPDRELVDWIKERVLLPWPEWLELADAITRDRILQEEKEPREPIRLPAEILSKLVRLRIPGASAELVASLERLPEILAGFYPGKKVAVEPFLDAVGPFQARRSLAEPPEVPGDELLSSLLGEWIQFYGPVRIEEISRKLAVDPGRLELGLEDLKDSEAVASGRLVRDDRGEYVCDAENLEILLRLERASAVPRVEPRRIEDLPLFLAHLQGLLLPGAGEEGLYSALEKLVGYRLPAPLWESDILPARVSDYSVTELDSILRLGDLRWEGGPKKGVRFFFERDLELVRPDEPAADDEKQNLAKPAAGATFSDLRQLFIDPAARYDFEALLGRAEGGVSALEHKLWAEVWQGRLTNDTFSALRRGLQTGFRVAEVIERQKKSLRFAPRRVARSLSSWREEQAYPGNWLLIRRGEPQSAGDLIELEERRKDRARLLLDRYGILFRELLQPEESPFRWSDLFRTLRLMELSGEILAGYFFAGIAGPQFFSQRAFRAFRQDLPRDAVFWMSAVDPCSVCGLALEGLHGVFPKRVEGTHLVFRGSQIILISQRKGRRLNFLEAPDDPRLTECFVLFHHLLKRQFSPMQRIVVEAINDTAAPQSPYLDALKRNFDVVVDIKQVSLYSILEK